MPVVIDHDHPGRFALALEPPIDSAKRRKTAGDRVERQAKLQPHRQAASAFCRL